MKKIIYKVPATEYVGSITEEVLAQSSGGTLATPDLIEEELEW